MKEHTQGEGKEQEGNKKKEGNWNQRWINPNKQRQGEKKERMKERNQTMGIWKKKVDGESTYFET